MKIKLYLLAVATLFAFAVCDSHAQTPAKSVEKAGQTSIVLKSVGVDTTAIAENIATITARLEVLRAEVKQLNKAKTAQKALLRNARKAAAR